MKQDKETKKNQKPITKCQSAEVAKELGPKKKEELEKMNKIKE